MISCGNPKIVPIFGGGSKQPPCDRTERQTEIHTPGLESLKFLLRLLFPTGIALTFGFSLVKMEIA